MTAINTDAHIVQRVQHTFWMSACIRQLLSDSDEETGVDGCSSRRSLGAAAVHSTPGHSQRVINTAVPTTAARPGTTV